MAAEQTTDTATQVIRTDHWVLPVDSLDGWVPRTAFLDYRVFEGPDIGPREKGLSLKKDLMGGCNGPRGSCKTATMSFLIAKKMRDGATAYTNYPISFYVIEKDGTLTYYESYPLDVEKLCHFHPDLRRAVIGITELQYYVEARTSGRLQNRMLSYQIMQIRKTANSFFYDVQAQEWVDKRFGWSDDFSIECRDVSKQNYTKDSVSDFPPGMLESDGNLKEGAVSLWDMKDISGVLTGTPYKKSGTIYTDIQFDAWYVWDIFPTHFIIDAWSAYHTLNTEDDAKTKEKEALVNAMNLAISEFIEDGEYKIEASNLWNKVSEKLGNQVNPYRAGRILKEAGVTKKPDGYGNYYYDLSIFTDLKED